MPSADADAADVENSATETAQAAESAAGVPVEVEQFHEDGWRQRRVVQVMRAESEREGERMGESEGVSPTFGRRGTLTKLGLEERDPVPHIRNNRAPQDRPCPKPE